MRPAEPLCREAEDADALAFCRSASEAISRPGPCVAAQLSLPEHFGLAGELHSLRKPGSSAVAVVRSWTHGLDKPGTLAPAGAPWHLSIGNIMPIFASSRPREALSLSGGGAGRRVTRAGRLAPANAVHPGDALSKPCSMVPVSISSVLSANKSMLTGSDCFLVGVTQELLVVCPAARNSTRAVLCFFIDSDKSRDGSAGFSTVQFSGAFQQRMRSEVVYAAVRMVTVSRAAYRTSEGEREEDGSVPLHLVRRFWRSPVVISASNSRCSCPVFMPCLGSASWFFVASPPAVASRCRGAGKPCRTFVVVASVFFPVQSQPPSFGP